MIRLTTVFALLTAFYGFGQQQSGTKRVSLTIDDVPNTRLYQVDQASLLLNSLDSLKVPTTIFINKGLIFRGDTVANTELLKSWMEKNFIISGNHTFSHSRYSDVGFDDFVEDVEKGELHSLMVETDSTARMSYFRFPYNDLGKDSVQHAQIASYMAHNNYRITPFTIESSDWMFNAMYRHYLKLNDSVRAAEIGNMYVDETLKLFEFYDLLAMTEYGRYVDQIYLCHDNKLNTDYLPQLLKRLEEKKYTFISLDEALKDPIYSQEDIYFKKWGISWFYRWMKDDNRRKGWMHTEPPLKEVYELYESLKKSDEY